MNADEIIALDLLTTSVHELRRVAARNGIKGLGSAKRADIVARINDAKVEAIKARIAAKDAAEAAERAEQAAIFAADDAVAEEVANADLGCAGDVELATEAVDAVKNQPTKGFCHELCGRRVINAAKKGQPEGNLCRPCLEWAEAENTHSDEGHEEERDLIDACPICGTAVDPREALPIVGASRKGMVVVAKGGLAGKIEVLKNAAEAAGWEVKMHGDAAQLEAWRAGESIVVSWDDRGRFSYENSSFLRKGKTVKLRNLAAYVRAL